MYIFKVITINYVTHLWGGLGAISGLAEGDILSEVIRTKP